MNESYSDGNRIINSVSFAFLIHFLMDNSSTLFLSIFSCWYTVSYFMAYLNFIISELFNGEIISNGTILEFQGTPAFSDIHSVKQIQVKNPIGCTGGRKSCVTLQHSFTINHERINGWYEPGDISSEMLNFWSFHENFSFRFFDSVSTFIRSTCLQESWFKILYIASYL